MRHGASTASRGGDRRPIRTRNVPGSRGRKIIPASFRGLCRDNALGDGSSVRQLQQHIGVVWLAEWALASQVPSSEVTTQRGWVELFDVLPVEP
jgi:hypothetical protein